MANGNGGNGRKDTFKRSKLARQIASDLHQEKIGHRPSMYKGDVTDEQAYRLALLGATDREMADVLCISVETMVRWRTEHPSFCQAVINGKDEADAKVAEAMYRRAIGYEHPDIHIAVFRDKSTGEITKEITPITKHYPPDPVCCFFWLKNRQRDHWRDVKRTEITGANDGPIQHESILTLDLSKLTDQELDMLQNIGMAVKQKQLTGQVFDLMPEPTDGERE
jgi:hypothetical protein